MNELRMCPERDALVTHLYGEADAAERARFDAHLIECAACRDDLEALGAVRTALVSWKPPAQAFGFRLVRDPVVVPFRRPWYSVPRWAQAAAAVLLLAAAAAVANLDVRYGSDGLVVRTGWQKPPAGSVDPRRQAVRSPWRADLAALERQLRTEFHATEVVSQPASAGMGMSDAEFARRVQAVLGGGGPRPAPASFDPQLLKKVESLVQASEDRQRRELAVRMLQVNQDFEAQRRIDLARIQQGFGQIENRTGLETNQTREMLNYLMRASQKK